MRIEGRVQGVGFRYWTAQQARRYNLDGWVCNLRDGSVELVAQGEPEQLTKLRAAVAKGPPLSRVDRIVDLPTHEDSVARGFQIRMYPDASL